MIHLYKYIMRWWQGGVVATVLIIFIAIIFLYYYSKKNNISFLHGFWIYEGEQNIYLYLGDNGRGYILNYSADEEEPEKRNIADNINFEYKISHLSSLNYNNYKLNITADVGLKSFGNAETIKMDRNKSTIKIGDFVFNKNQAI